MENDADCAHCATGRDLRRIGRRANFFLGEMIDSAVGNGDFPEYEEKGDFQKTRMISGTCQVCEKNTIKLEVGRSSFQIGSRPSAPSVQL